MDIVNIDWLEKNLNNDGVVILDCSWHLPNTNRSGEKESFHPHQGCTIPPAELPFFF